MKQIDPASLYAGLNPAQREAVTAEGPLLVLAGAGSGKTRVLTYRIAHLILHGVPASKILAVTFTKKAATEMQERVSKLAGKTAKQVTLCTFHALGYRLLREFRKEAGLPYSFRIASEKAKARIVSGLLKKFQVQRDYSEEDALAVISDWRNSGKQPVKTKKARFIRKLIDGYVSGLREEHLVDFDDMQLLPVTLLESSLMLRKRLQQRWAHLLIDEYQDTNPIQYRFAKCLVSKTRSICAVGDDDQSIYSFRGSSRKVIRSFERDFSGARVVKLEHNYRSSPQILNVARDVVTQSRDRDEKRIIATAPSGPPVQWIVHGSDEYELAFIKKTVRKLKRKKRFSWDDVAILLRVNSDVELIDAALRNADIPTKRVTESSSQPAVTVSTLHASKGLEWPIVFLPGLEDGKVPHANAIEEGSQSIDEERRLFYVGVTRAKLRLFLTSAHLRNGQRQEASRFLTQYDKTNAYLIVKRENARQVS